MYYTTIVVSGIKTFVNEFAAYIDLGGLIDNKEDYFKYLSQNRTWEYTGDMDITFHAMPPLYNTTSVLRNGYLQVRVVATLCFFDSLTNKV